MNEYMVPQHVVIVGAGQAGGETAAELRRHAYSGTITIVGDEPSVPYKRPHLSKAYLAGNVTQDSLHVMSPAAMEKASIRFLANTAVLGIDRAAHTIELSGSQLLHYDKLVLATGARARLLNCPGAELPNIYVLRSIADVDAIRLRFSRGARLVIVGGGYIGLEVAAVAVKAGLHVVVLESASRVLQRVTAPEMSAFYERVHREAGVDLQTDAQLSGFYGSGSCLRVLLGNGSSLEADLVIVGIGIEPNQELAATAGIEVDNGIIVDEFTRTSDPDIYAVGDCTSHPSAFFGRRLRLESVQNAMEQGRAAALNLMGKPTRYTMVPWFWSDQYDLKLQMVGLSAGYDQCVLRGDPLKRNFSAFYFREGRVIAVDTVSRPHEFMVAKKMVAANVVVDPSQLGDETVPLRDIVERGQ